MHLNAVLGHILDHFGRLGLGVAGKEKQAVNVHQMLDL
jgi:hypothetical protein